MREAHPVGKCGESCPKFNTLTGEIKGYMVDNKKINWYVAHTRVNQELWIKKKLDELGIENFLPQEEQVRETPCLILKKLTCSTSKLMSVATKSSGLSRHTIEEKIEAVRQRIFQESSFRELQERHGICSATLSVWIKKYKAEVLRRFPVKDLPLYVLKYQETMTTEEENELTRLRRENEDLKLLHEANLLMIDMAKERFGIDIKKNYEEMLSGGCLKEVPGVKGNDE